MTRAARYTSIVALSLFSAACDTTDNNTDDTDVTGTCLDGETAFVDGVDGICCDDADVCRMFGTITADVTLDADKTWLLEGGVFFGDDANEYTLTIPAGTTIFGDTSTEAFLVIQRHADIVAEGTAAKPITFTSSKNDGSRGAQDWGGLVINGLADANVCTDPVAGAPGEAGTGQFCGDDDDDSSGSLEYVRVQFAGKLINDQQELNGIAFQGVGAGTNLDYIHVNQTADDGVEFFGGAAEIKHLIVSGAGDDMLDWTDGWRGKVQHALLVQTEGNGDNGIEADNNGDANDATPRSFPAIANITIIGAQSDDGSGGTQPSDAADIGMLLREGTAANVSHAIVMGWGEACGGIDQEPTFINAWDTTNSMLTGNLTVESSIFHCPDVPGYDGSDDATMFPVTGTDSTLFTNAEFFTTLNMPANTVTDPKLTDAYAYPPDASPSDTTVDTTNTVFDGDSFFDTNPGHIGAFGASDWSAGWSDFSQN